jgi:tetratricopeptide (TPR) repeat protein
MGELDLAKRYLAKAIEINPNKPDEHLYLGLTLLKMGSVDEAATSLRRAIEIRPNGVGYHFALGAILRLQGNLQGALGEFKAEAAVSPQLAAARQQIAEIQASLDQQGAKK